MLKQIYKIDASGYLQFGQEVQIEKDRDLPVGYIDVPLPTDSEGFQLPFYRPKWVGTGWVEDMTQEEIDELNKPTKEQEVIGLKKQLEETDYQIIKSSEYQLLGLEVPYNLEEIHIERQAIRDKINELENL